LFFRSSSWIKLMTTAVLFAKKALAPERRRVRALAFSELWGFAKRAF
jgi:hypothetical protein